MHEMQNKNDTNVGFTLIELSIVLVIIGLIVGGILVGRDLILTARAQKTVKEFNALAVAITTFKTKYGCLPGDCSNASQFGLGTDGNGNGDIDGNDNNSDGYLCLCNDDPCTVNSESNAALLHLSAANLISQPISALTSALAGQPLINSGTLPVLTFGTGNYWPVSIGGFVYIVAANPTLSSNGCFGTYGNLGTDYAFTPLEALMLTVKLSGNSTPGSIANPGAVFAGGPKASPSPLGALSSGYLLRYPLTNCATPGTFDYVTTNDSPACNLGYRAQ